MNYSEYHDEVLSSLLRIGRPTLAAKMGPDRRSNLEYCGVRVPNRRSLVKQGFSFYEFESTKILDIWHDLWMHSTNGDVLFCAVDYYLDRVRKRVELEHWKKFRLWVQRVENWAHSDALCSIYSRFVETRSSQVMNDISTWNHSDELWTKRVSIVSLIHYTGKNACFLPFQTVSPFLERCITDHRDYMQKATGWVLRECHTQEPEEVEKFLSANLSSIGAIALSRALERISPVERREWRERKKKAVLSTT